MHSLELRILCAALALVAGMSGVARAQPSSEAPAALPALPPVAPVPLLPAPAPAAPAPAPAAPELLAERALPAASVPASDASDADDAPEHDAAEVIEIIDRYIPGAAQTIGARELQRFEYNDIHQVLGSVPGVYIREEDGYGLRPNIGMRGSGAERSAKIALMEDGVLIAPAPYAAPAAYYFPTVTRMERIDVLKGPAAIQYGPNTVGGAVNLISKPVPRRREAELDLAAGQDRYGKLHASVAESWRHAAILIEGVKLRSDGFKVLDTGGSTGFDRNDLQLKLRLNSDTASAVYHQLDVKLGYADEVSNETYTGLTDADFALAPYRRYAGTQLDRVEWQHLRMQLGHQVELGNRVRVVTTLYRNQFARDWAKLNGFNVNVPLTDILARPSAGSNAVFYSVLTGESDSTSEAEMLILGTNARTFVSQGIQLAAQVERRVLGAWHTVDVGLRYHEDEVNRYHFEDAYWMTGGAMMRADTSTVVSRDALGTAQAVAVHAQDKMRVGALTATAGLRTEVVRTSWHDRMRPADDRSDLYSVLIPGAGVLYQVRPSLGVLAGVHKGFVPVSPGQPDDVSPEASVNYEAGVRYASGLTSAEAIGFFSDYSNLKGSCSFSSGCASENVDDEFNGGRVRVLGVEAMAASEVPLGASLRVPLKATYTFNRSRFQTSFTSSNPEWGNVAVGDELPYLPAHQISVQVGLGQAGMDRSGVPAMRWEVSLAGRYTSAMRDVAGHGEVAPAARTEAVTVLDLAASYDLDRWGRAYLTVDNVLDDAYIVSRRPYGARPGKPRLVIVGYKNRF